ncbi:MAG: hypothetical protein ACHP84_01545 [Caulobacterales bacterium]
MLLFTTTAAALGAVLGLPVKKALAASPQMPPGPVVNRAPAQLEVIQPRFVNATAATLLRIADQALSNNALAERIFRDPDGVAAQYHLSNSERLVLRHMDQTQFQVARADAARLVATRLSSGRSMPPGATDGRLIGERMIVGRAILAAVGRSYREAASANACCPWSKAIEVGVGGDPAAYNAGFARPSGVR